MAQIMVDLWTSFAINGVPNLPRFKGEDGNNDNATWPPYLGNFDVEFQFLCFFIHSSALAKQIKHFATK